MNILNVKNHDHVDHIQHVSHIRHVNRVWHVDHVQHVGCVYHVDHVQYLDHSRRVSCGHRIDHVQHGGQPKYPETDVDDNIKFCNKSGDKVQFIILRIFRLMDKLIEAFPVKMELQIVDGYVYRYKRAAGGAAQFLNYSRLDYIFVSNAILFKISGASIDWAFESSDQASVKINFAFEEEPTRGPGIVKVNTKILDDPAVVLQIGR